MKNIIFLLCCIFYMSALGQSHFVEDTPEVRNWLDNMFQHLDKSKIPHGLLRDYAFELADLDIYNGKELNDSNYVDRVAFENLSSYRSLLLCGCQAFQCRRGSCHPTLPFWKR